MKHGVVKLIGISVLFITSVFSGSKLYAEDGEKESGWTIVSDSKKTLYVAHWTHTPENCPGRSGDGAKMLSKFWEGRKKAEEKGIKILGAYVTVTEHDYFIIFEANDYSAAVEFFLPLCPSQTGKIVPVLTMDEWLKIMPK
ncbi:MAG TPA: DUF3303 domain-containing protein [Candidatus Wunengus sp. YC60]|uniref:DUF3303 domain-containing protein n=1 Tax=Candidatus Wunengus sp. YC60 TaxID=3367697 RepID=UPI00402669B3